MQLDDSTRQPLLILALADCSLIAQEKGPAEALTRTPEPREHVPHYTRVLRWQSMSEPRSFVSADAVGAYARVRTQFKVPIGKFEGVEEALTRMGGNLYLMDAARMLTAAAVDCGEKPAVVSAIAPQNWEGRTLPRTTATINAPNAPQPAPSAAVKTPP